MVSCPPPTINDNMKHIIFLVLSFACLWNLPAQAQKDKKQEVNKAEDFSRVRDYDVSFLQGSAEDFELDFGFDEETVNYLFIIAVDKYRYWKSLSNAVKDAQDVKKVLMERYGFKSENIYELLNEEVSAESVRETFEIIKRKGTNIDNLLIYYSGHGYYDPSFDLGYWVPSEGRTNKGAVSTYIPNDQIRNYIKAMDFRHILMIADACFSGSLFASGTRGEMEAEEAESIKSRWGLSSGNIELVSDGKKGENSPFAHYLLTYLRNNLKDALKASELVEYVKKQVADNTEQTPLGGQLSGVGSEGGEYIFRLTGVEENYEEETTNNKKKNKK